MDQASLLKHIGVDGPGRLLVAYEDGSRNPAAEFVAGLNPRATWVNPLNPEFDAAYLSCVYDIRRLLVADLSVGEKPPVQIIGFAQSVTLMPRDDSTEEYLEPGLLWPRFQRVAVFSSGRIDLRRERRWQGAV